MNIRPEIREKVISAAKELNYTPNAFARMLAGHKTNLIAIVLGPSTGPYYTQILLQFIYKLQQKQKQLLPFSMSGNMRYRDIFEQIRPFRVDAIILTSAASGAAFEPGETDIPIILLEQMINGLSIHSVCSDSFSAGSSMAEMLVRNGHRRIAFVSGNGSVTQDYGRDYGFASRMNDFGLKVWRTELAIYANYQSGQVAARRLLAGQEYPDAVFCADDVLAMAMIDVAKNEFSLSVPDDLSVTGFHNVKEAALPPYSLTTMQSPVEMMVDAVIDIIDRLDTIREPVSVKFPMKPVIRRSMKVIDPEYIELQRAWLDSDENRITFQLSSR